MVGEIFTSASFNAPCFMRIDHGSASVASEESSATAAGTINAASRSGVHSITGLSNSHSSICRRAVAPSFPNLTLAESQRSPPLPVLGRRFSFSIRNTCAPNSGNWPGLHRKPFPL